MNAPLKPQTGQSDTSYCKFGSETLLKLLPVFEAQIEGVKKSNDIEYVHKMRVTSRRLRAALPLFRFCFPGKECKEWVKQLKKVTRLLADARDLDVQVAFIEQYMKKLKSATEKECVETLLRIMKTPEKASNLLLSADWRNWKHHIFYRKFASFVNKSF